MEFKTKLSPIVAIPQGMAVTVFVDDKIIGGVRIMQSTDGLVRFYAHNAGGAKLGRVDGMGHAVALVCKDYVDHLEKLPSSGPDLHVIEGGKGDVDLH